MCQIVKYIIYVVDQTHSKLIVNSKAILLAERLTLCLISDKFELFSQIKKKKICIYFFFLNGHAA